VVVDQARVSSGSRNAGREIFLFVDDVNAVVERLQDTAGYLLEDPVATDCYYIWVIVLLK
jgi:hypothetical protein